MTVTLGAHLTAHGTEPRVLVPGLASRGARHAVYGIGLFSALINVLALTGSMFMLQVYDRVLPSHSVPTLVVLAILTATLFAFYGLLDLFRGRMLVRLGTWLDATISPQVYLAIVRLPLAGIPSTSSKSEEPLRDLDTVRSFLSGQGPCVLADLPWVPVYLGVIYLFHPVLTLLALAGMFVLVLVMLVTDRFTKGPIRTATEYSAERQHLAETSRRNAEALTALGMVGRYREHWTKANDLYMASQQQASDLAGGLGALSRALRLMLQSAVLALGAYLVIRQEATAGIIIASTILTGRALAPLDLAIPNWKNWTAARQSWQRLKHVLEIGSDDGTLMPLRSPGQQLTLETVSVTPPGNTRLVVQDVSFTLSKGQGLGIIGPSAAGKSSLARLLVGVWTPVRGKVRLDGAALDQWSPEVLGRHIGYLPQAVELLPGTVSDNIARFEAEADPEAVIRAAEAASLHDLIVRLADGYQTMVGELSAGQQQRVALARALYGNPFLVVLDEPNSNLDADGEAALTRAILRVRQRGGLAVVIAHHPSALAGVDSLMVMNAGRIQAIGPKEEIWAKVLSPVAMRPPLKLVTETTGSS